MAIEKVINGGKIKKTIKFLENCDLLLNHIYGLVKSKRQYCIATDKYLGKIIGKSERQVKRYLQYLKNTQQITVDTSALRKDEKNGKLYKKRYIGLGSNVQDDTFKNYQTIKNVFFDNTLQPEDKTIKIQQIMNEKWRQADGTPKIRFSIVNTSEIEVPSSDYTPGPLITIISQPMSNSSSEEPTIAPIAELIVKEPEEVIKEIADIIKQRFEDSKFNDDGIVNQYAYKKARQREAAIASGKFTIEDFCFGEDYCDPPTPPPENETDDERFNRISLERKLAQDETEARKIDYNIRYLLPDEIKRYLDAITRLVKKQERLEEEWVNRMLAKEKR